ncbi:MAG: hypothetical protein ACFB10_21615 [Salibacteraceae bacterium]
MKQALILIWGMLLLSLSYQGKTQNFEGQQQFKLYSNATIVWDPVKVHYKSYKVESGSDLVFEFSTDNSSDPGNHSKVISKFSFQVPEKARKFSFTNKEITAQNGIYIEYGQTMDRGIKPIENGTISGQKLKDGSWEIEIDITWKGRLTGKTYRLQLTETYLLVN